MRFNRDGPDRSDQSLSAADKLHTHSLHHAIVTIIMLVINANFNNIIMVIVNVNFNTITMLNININVNINIMINL